MRTFRQVEKWWRESAHIWKTLPHQDTFKALLSRSPSCAEVKTASESKHQTAIIKLLEQEGFEVIRVTMASKSGVSDIVACSPAGRFWKIECKHEEHEPSRLQLIKLRKFWKNKAVAMIAYSFDDFQYKYLKIIKPWLKLTDETQTTN